MASAKEKFQSILEQLKELNKDIQIKFTRETQLQATFDGCMANCRPKITAGQQLVAEKKARAAAAGSEFTLDPQEFQSRFLTSFEDQLTIEQASACAQKCHLPVQRMKKIMGTHVKEISTNMEKCLQTQAKFGQPKVNYEEAVVCGEHNSKILGDYGRYLEQNDYFRGKWESD